MSNITHMNTQHNIINIRRSLGLTQAEVAAELNVSPACISNWEAGYRRLLPEKAKKYIKLAEKYKLKYTLNDIYGV